MKKIVLTLLLGVIAGTIDIIPMILQKLCIYSLSSAFIHWIVLSFIINYLQINLRGWLKGLVVAEFCTLAMVILIAKVMPGATIPILTMTAILGSFVGYFSEKLKSN